MRELIINCALNEYRIALLENGEISELVIEKKNQESIVGNIYKGKVARVLPGMNAAFVDISLPRAAFLYAGDIQTGNAKDFFSEFDDDEKKPSEEEEEQEEETKKSRFQRPEQSNIADLIKEGQEILVQVAKDPLGTKGARVTTYLSYAGRYLVYMPGVDNVGVSRRISNDGERNRLKDIISKLKPANGGFIGRTVAEDASAKKLKADIDFLVRQHKECLKIAEKARAPHSVYTDLDVVLRAIRDMVTDDIDRIVVDSRTEYKEINKFVSRYGISERNVVELYTGTEPIFDVYGIELELSRALERKVWLKSGGYLVVDQAEACAVIDVNTGKFVGKRNLEETILKTNLEAVKEIAYQIKLRNLGGIIIIDFIDMDRPNNRDKVTSALEEALKKDKAKTNIMEISKLGMVEMTRKRTRESILRTLCEPCSYCDAKGMVKSRHTICNEIFRAIQREGAKTESKSILVYANPKVAGTLIEEEKETMASLEGLTKKRLVVKSDPNFHAEQFEVLGAK